MKHVQHRQRPVPVRLLRLLLGAALTLTSAAATPFGDASPIYLRLSATRALLELLAQPTAGGSCTAQRQVQELGGSVSVTVLIQVRDRAGNVTATIPVTADPLAGTPLIRRAECTSDATGVSVSLFVQGQQTPYVARQSRP